MTKKNLEETLNEGEQWLVNGLREIQLKEKKKKAKYIGLVAGLSIIAFTAGYYLTDIKGYVQNLINKNSNKNKEILVSPKDTSDTSKTYKYAPNPDIYVDSKKH